MLTCFVNNTNMLLANLYKDVIIFCSAPVKTPSIFQFNLANWLVLVAGTAFTVEHRRPRLRLTAHLPTADVPDMGQLSINNPAASLTDELCPDGLCLCRLQRATW